MKTKLLSIMILLAFVGPACLGTTTYQSGSGGPVKITGNFKYTNDFVVETYYVEHAVAMVDMHGFVIRDMEWTIPVGGQALGFMQLDTTNKKGTYQIDLPAVPEGTYNDLSGSTVKARGVQIFCVSYWGNLVGGPYAEGDDKEQGWPQYLTSTIIDAENKDEVIGGELIVWAPDDQQKFPTGFGSDGLLFTADDPLGTISAGYSVINLDAKPFGISREAEQKITLYEPKDVALKDYSKESYSKAFDDMFQFVRTNYAFNGIPGKAPNWDTLYATLSPKVKAAEQTKDALAYFKAFQEFTLAFKDGHVGLDGGDTANNYIQEQIGGGYGFAIRELDDKKVIVNYLLDTGPAAAAGIMKGAEVTKFNRMPIGQAISQVVPVTGPSSTDFGLRYQQARFLLRSPVGTKISISYINPGGTEQTADLTAIQERGSLAATSLFAGSDQNALPVEFKILDSGVGYVRINSNYDDLNLIVRLFDRALKTFKQNQLTGIIIDMRRNAGGSPLGLAGFLTDKDIPGGQLEYFSTKTNKFEPEGPREKFTPNVEQYPLLKNGFIGQPGMLQRLRARSIWVQPGTGHDCGGQTPSAGTEAEVARGDFRLPEGMSMQVPTGRFTLPDGSIFLEGKGVPPTLRVPTDQETVLSTGDPVLDAAVKAVTQ